MATSGMHNCEYAVNNCEAERRGSVNYEVGDREF